MRNLLHALLAFVLITLAFGAIYVTAQQLERGQAEDTPRRLASQIAAELASGSSATVDALAPVDLGVSLAPWVTVVDRSDVVTAGNATLDGSPAVPPAGVLASARSSGSDRVTWAPRGDLRFATVEIAVGDRVVIAGQSLQPNEARIDRLGPMLAAGWALTAVIGVVGVFVADVYRRRVAAGS